MKKILILILMMCATSIFAQNKVDSTLYKLVQGIKYTCDTTVVPVLYKNSDNYIKYADAVVKTCGYKRDDNWYEITTNVFYILNAKGEYEILDGKSIIK